MDRVITMIEDTVAIFIKHLGNIKEKEVNKMDEIKWIYDPMNVLPLAGGNCCHCSTEGPDTPGVCQYLTDHLVIVKPPIE